MLETQSPAEVSQLIDHTIRTFQKECIPLNTVELTGTSQALRKLLRAKNPSFLWSLLALLLLSCLPLPFALLARYLPVGLAPLYQAWIWVTAVLVLLSILAVHAAFLRWKHDVVLVAGLLSRIEDVEIASKVMLGAFRLSPQLAFSGIAALILLGLLLFAVPEGTLVARFVLSLPFLGMFMVLGNGAYWAFMSLVGILLLYRASHLNVNFFDPSSTPGIKTFSDQLALHLALTAVTFLVFAFGIYVTFQSDVPSTRMIVEIWSGFAMLVLTVTFIYHQALYYLVVQREKNRILDELARSISETYGKEPTEEILSKIKLYQTIRDTRSTALHADVVIPYVVGVATQVLPLIATSEQLAPWLKILQTLVR